MAGEEHTNFLNNNNNNEILFHLLGKMKKAEEINRSYRCILQDIPKTTDYNLNLHQNI